MIEPVTPSRDPMSEQAEKRRPHVTVIHNPAAGLSNGRRLTRFASGLIKIGITFAIRPTAACGDAEMIAAGIAADETDVLAIAGGDGTINEVINGLSPLSPPLALLPLGTANVLAAELGVPRRPERLARSLITGRIKRVCLPRANGRRFVMMAGVGFDAHVVAAVDPALKRLAGKAAYVASFAAMLRRFTFPGYDVTVDGRHYRAASVVVANGRFYGGRFSCAPNARLDEPDLHVCLFLRPGRRAALAYGLSLLRGRLDRRDDVLIVRGRCVCIDGIAGEPVQLDGDIAACLPLCIEATEETARFLAPPPAGRPARIQRPATVIPSMRTVGESVP
ncbi:MAG: diacylglycerol kinase family lipid kinase [Rhodospirillales bacterium]|nr:diacylglycerol kinase family lipid kinase [Rhodospirillales bacterium]